jgi:hypothetical protein
LAIAVGNLFPVPVKILNYREKNQLVNFDSATRSESKSATLQHRFYMVDNLSGRTVSSQPPTIFSFAKHAELRLVAIRLFLY